MAQNQNFNLLKMLVELHDKELYQLCKQLREKEKIPQNSAKIPNGVCAKVDQQLKHVLESCKKDIEENYDDFIDYLGTRARVKSVRTRLFSVALHTSLLNKQKDRSDDENEI